MASTQLQVFTKTFRASADLSAKQFFAVKLSASVDEDVALAGAGEGVGVLINTPADNELADVVLFGGAKAKLAGTVSSGDFLKVDSDGKFVAAASDKNYYVARALQAGVAGDIIEVFVCPGFLAA